MQLRSVVQTPCYSHDTPDCLDTPRQLITGLMRWARSGATSDPLTESTWRSLYTSVAAWSEEEHPIRTLRDRAWPALSYRNDAALSPALAAQLFPSPLKTDVRRIETFAECPFRHFAKYGLTLAPREEGRFALGQAGMTMHQVLDLLVARLLHDRKRWADLSDIEAAEQITTFATEVTRDFLSDEAPDAARQQYVLNRIVHSLRQVVMTQRAVERVQSLQPERVSAKFGPNASDPLKSPRIVTPAGRTVELHGRIDRIDQVPGKPLRVVTDYKSAAASLDLSDVYHGLALQLLAFMLVLRENNAGAERLTPIGALYQRVTRSLEAADFPTAPAENGEDDAFCLRDRTRGIVHLQHLSVFDASLVPGGSSKVVAASLKVDGTLGRANTSDALDAADINRLLDHVRQKIAELCDALMNGDVRVRPYRIGTTTPCPRCEFRSVCRFEPGINSYHKLTKLGRSEVLAGLASPPAMEESRG